jgi:hypothetical protein
MKFLKMVPEGYELSNHFSNAHKQPAGEKLPLNVADGSRISEF